MTPNSPRPMSAELTAAATLHTETTRQRLLLAWGQALCAEAGRVWAALDAEETLAYEEKLATQVHVLDDAAASLRVLSHRMARTSRRYRRHLRSLRA